MQKSLQIILFFRITPAEDAEYAKAVEAGDKAVMRRMVDEAAAKAMPDTKVVGKDGDADFNIISSVFGKGKSNVENRFKNGYATYINEKS